MSRLKIFAPVSILALSLATLAACGGPGSSGTATSAKKLSKNGGVSYSNDIQPIWDARCVSCHGDLNPRGGLTLTSTSSYANLVGAPTSNFCMSTAPGSVYVNPGDTQSSMLWLKLAPDDARCANPMPLMTPGLGVIAPEDFALIDQWILEGAPNN